MAVQGTPRKFYQKYKYQVEISGVRWAGFRTMSDLSVNVDEVAQREGGALIPNKEPGLVNVDDVTLARGATDDRDLWEWMKEVIEAGSIVDSPAHKRDIDIVQQDRRGVEIARWTLYGCWPKKFKAGDWDNEASENVITEVILAFDYFDEGGD